MDRDFCRRWLKARALYIVFASTFVCAVGSLMRAFTQDDHAYIRRAIEKCGPLCKAGEGVFTPSLFSITVQLLYLVKIFLAQAFSRSEVMDISVHLDVYQTNFSRSFH